MNNYAESVLKEWLGRQVQQQESLWTIGESVDELADVSAFTRFAATGCSG
jgi:hypothetical protein